MTDATDALPAEFTEALRFTLGLRERLVLLVIDRGDIQPDGPEAAARIAATAQVLSAWIHEGADEAPAEAALEQDAALDRTGRPWSKARERVLHRLYPKEKRNALVLAAVNALPGREVTWQALCNRARGLGLTRDCKPAMVAKGRRVGMNAARRAA